MVASSKPAVMMTRMSVSNNGRARAKSRGADPAPLDLLGNAGMTICESAVGGRLEQWVLRVVTALERSERTVGRRRIDLVGERVGAVLGGPAQIAYMRVGPPGTTVVGNTPNGRATQARDFEHSFYQPGKIIIAEPCGQHAIIGGFFEA